MIETEDLKPFPMTIAKEVFRCPIFSVNEQTATSLDGATERRIYSFECANWVNVVPITADGKVVLIEQQRFGTGKFTLETPGGAVDRGEKDLTMAALRELQEETGYTSQRLLSLPSFSPNPALQSNQITYFVAFDVMPMQQPVSHDDPFEVIKVHLVDFDDALLMARSGQIGNALCTLALLLAEPLFRSKKTR